MSATHFSGLRTRRRVLLHRILQHHCLNRNTNSPESVLQPLLLRMQPSTLSPRSPRQLHRLLPRPRQAGSRSLRQPALATDPCPTVLRAPRLRPRPRPRRPSHPSLRPVLWQTEANCSLRPKKSDLGRMTYRQPRNRKLLQYSLYIILCSSVLTPN